MSAYIEPTAELVCVIWRYGLGLGYSAGKKAEGFCLGFYMFTRKS